MIDKRPAAIAYCADEADVAAALRYGVEHDLRIAVRGGGHNGGGLGSVDDGLVIDLSPMNAIEVDAAGEDGARRRWGAAQGLARRRRTSTG
jgi:FAD/FMN-containing dehydrogenase